MTTRVSGIPAVLLALAGLGFFVPAAALAQDYGTGEDVNWFDDAEVDGLFDAAGDEFSAGLEGDGSMAPGGASDVTAEDVKDFGVGDDYEAALDDDRYGLDDSELGGRGFRFDPNYLTSDDYGVDSYGAFDTDYVWQTGDQSFDSWYGDSDLGWE